MTRGPSSIPDQVRAALRKASSDAAADHAERVAFHKLADAINDDAAIKLRSLLRP